jgi:hypothetical protein
MTFSLKVLCFFWQIGLIDGFGFYQFLANGSVQYGVIVLSAAGENLTNISPMIMFEPVVGLGTSFKYIAAAKTVAERKARIATLAGRNSHNNRSANKHGRWSSSCSGVGAYAGRSQLSNNKINKINFFIKRFCNCC